MCIDLKNNNSKSSGRGMTLCLAVVVIVLLWWVLSLLPAAIDQALGIVPPIQLDATVISR